MANDGYTIEELIKNTDEGFIKLNAAKLGLGPPTGTAEAMANVLHVMYKKETVNKMHVAPKAERIYRGITFKSKKEANKAAELDLAKQAGEIKGYLMQVPFILPGKTKSGRPIRHYVDFGIIELDDRMTWLECKGRDLELGRLKRAQCEEIYGIKIKVE
jgi:hypothetical protein